MVHRLWHQEPDPNNSKQEKEEIDDIGQNPEKKNPNLLLDFRHLEDLEVHLPLSS